MLIFNLARRFSCLPIVKSNVNKNLSLLKFLRVRNLSASMGKNDEEQQLERDLYDRCFATASDLVHKAGAIVRLNNESRPDFKQKDNDIDLVTETDKGVEKLLIDGLKNAFPDHKFIGEEQTAAGQTSQLTDAPTWIIDPVDGTMNFVHSFPHSCISVGLVVNKIPEIAIVYNPLLNQLFTARRNQGAYYNGRRICVSKQTDLRLALITTEFGTSRDPNKMSVVYENMRKIVENAHSVRVLGSAALNMAMVALGAVDANFEFGIHAWDVAASILLVTEAGGVVMDPAGGPLDLMSRRALAAATPELANSLVSLLTQYYPKPRDDCSE